MAHYYAANDTMRRNALVALSGDDVARIEQVKLFGQEFHDKLTDLGASRELSLAKTKIEEAVMWAVKHITA